MLSKQLIVAPNSQYAKFALPLIEYLKYKNEFFLHMESITLFYKNSVLYSNKVTRHPCYKYLNFNYKENKNLLCDQKGIYGAIENLPCKECIELNNVNKDIIISYIPDIAFGTNGKHQAWYEINYKHPCTKEKIEYCKRHKIVLFEFEAEFILNLDINTKCIIRNPLTQE